MLLGALMKKGENKYSSHDHIMMIYFRQSGGIAGMDNSISIDSDLLQPGEQLELERLVESAKFFDLPPPQSGAAPLRGADYFSYEITIEKFPKRYSITTTDLTMSPNLSPLVRYLRQKVLKQLGRQ
jgi:hypothetical protein